MKIIAESAFNHNGSFEYLLELAQAAKISGADYFTVQLMNVDAFCIKDSERYSLSKKTEIAKEQWIKLFQYCEKIDLNLIPCVLEENSFDLAYNYGFRLIKIHATDITNEPFLKYMTSKRDVKFLLETQCATLFEIKYALNILGKDNIEALFTGYSNYPSEVEELNLNVLDYLKKEFNLKIGFADHSLDVQNIPLMVLAKGADYIEKHITLTRNNRNYDWQVSLYPHEFASMVNAIKHYTIALGNGIKHPTEHEKPFRKVLYKKMIPNEPTLKRANEGVTFLENKIAQFKKEKVVVALIARLKSQRLKQKVLLPFCENEMVVDLYKRISTTKGLDSVVLATSDLREDDVLANRLEQLGLETYRGDAVSVIDRMLGLAFEKEAGAIFRVTGDNPFTDPCIMEKMIELMLEYDLDCVKVNNVPIGIGSELFSTQYLWNLYLKMKNPMLSEYLSWFVLNDKDVRIGSVDLEYKKSLKGINLSVDYLEDYKRCKNILNRVDIKNFTAISLKDVLENIPNEELETIDLNQLIKLPEGVTMKVIDYLDQYEKRDYIVRYKYIIS
ncbi:MAG: N-acetylneuraminate synthase family protein [Firmicutes bacterium]|nr:N-acetylneuraminate synthase family protein [Bacillota bacterium]